MLGIITRTIFSKLLLAIVIILFTPLFIIMLALPKKWFMKCGFLFYFVRLFYKAIMKFSLLPVTFIGKENLPNGPVIFVANHQSSLDIPLVGELAGNHPHVWLAKEELMDSKLLRFVLPRVAVLVDPESPRKAMRSMLEIIKLVNGSGAHLMIFPEGTRHTDGKLHYFYSGFVLLAKKTNRPIVPVRIFGVHEAYPPEQFWVNYCPIKVVIGKPMTLGVDEEDETFKDRVYEWFVSQSEK